MLASSGRFVQLAWRKSACKSAAAASTRSVVRPDLNFDYLLDEANVSCIRKNIASRKGIGDIDALRAVWKSIETFDPAQHSDKETAEKRYNELWDKLYEEALLIPNFSHKDAPEGDESAACVVRTIGARQREGKLFTAEALVKGWRSLFHPTTTSGKRSYAFLGSLSNLESQLLKFAYTKAVENGFKPVAVSDLVEKKVTAACGLVQRAEHTNIQYVLNDHPETCLSGTAEMGISALLRDRVIREEDLPLKMVAYSRCFRPEVSKSATEARLYRVHEFTKVEMFTVCAPEESENELQHLLDVQTDIFENLGLHCRVLDMPTQELGAPASRKFDIEAWMPGRKVFGEVSSTSNCTDFQSRRLNLTIKRRDESRCHAHTCNGTAIASTRAIVALLETLQTDKKGFTLPECLGISQRSRPIKLQQSSAFSYSFDC
ncbi:hypothetical protein L596_004597 [Steinernema carpocapsae]|uniref:serine--tRNA ligase n=1 Tax=Steinernema carpocapsae TaxID=34508 RepID=A0A4U8UZV5_STECR|nr:hypothetical protein L596_004597 [Steinernema carpocapsae]